MYFLKKANAVDVFIAICMWFSSLRILFLWQTLIHPPKSTMSFPCFPRVDLACQITPAF